MRKIILQSNRLLLTAFKNRDIIPLYCNCFSKWEIMKYLHGKTFTIKNTKAYINKNFSKGELFNFLVIIDKNSMEILGYGGILPYIYTNSYEFGYVLKKRAWKKGYALELAITQIETIKKTFPKSSIVATAHPKNLSSQKVLEKAGMKLIKKFINIPNRGIRHLYKYQP